MTSLTVMNPMMVPKSVISMTMLTPNSMIGCFGTTTAVLLKLKVSKLMSATGCMTTLPMSGGNVIRITTCTPTIAVLLKLIVSTGGIMTTTLDTSETPGSTGEWTETSTSTTPTDGLSTAMTDTSTFTTQTSGELTAGTGTGMDTTIPETATTCSTIPGTHGDTTWTSTLRTERTTTATTDGNTSGTQPTGDTTQDGLGYGTDTADSSLEHSQ